jgi:hypothetical protein
MHGCSCPTLRRTCNAATVLDGRARRLACFSMGSQDPARVTSLLRPLGRGPSLANTGRAAEAPRAWNIRLYAGVMPPKGDL